MAVDPVSLAAAALLLLALGGLLAWSRWEWRRRGERGPAAGSGVGGALLTLEGFLDPGRRAAIEYVAQQQEERKQPAKPGRLPPRPGRARRKRATR